MARYIDADRLIERLKASPIFQDFNTDGYFIRDMVIDLIGCQQISDVAPRSEIEREIGEEIYRIIGDGDNETWICLLIRKLADKLIKKNGSKAETCVVCGTAIPEGRQVCPNCEEGGDN